MNADLIVALEEFVSNTATRSTTRLMKLGKLMVA
jgi:hypothetical protein